MKKLVFILQLLILSISTINAQSQQYTGTNEWDRIRAVLNQIIEVDYDKYVGYRADGIYSTLKCSPYKIKHMSTIARSAWDAPDGIERMTGVILYNRTLRELDQDQKVYIIYIHLDTWLDDDMFWKSLPKENWMEAILERTKDMRVTDIRFVETTIYSNPKDE